MIAEELKELRARVEKLEREVEWLTRLNRGRPEQPSKIPPPEGSQWKPSSEDK